MLHLPVLLCLDYGFGGGLDDVIYIVFGGLEGRSTFKFQL